MLGSVWFVKVGFDVGFGWVKRVGSVIQAGFK